MKARLQRWVDCVNHSGAQGCVKCDGSNRCIGFQAAIDVATGRLDAVIRDLNRQISTPTFRYLMIGILEDLSAEIREASPPGMI